MRQNQRIIRPDACNPSSAGNVRRRPVQIATQARSRESFSPPSAQHRSGPRRTPALAKGARCKKGRYLLQVFVRDNNVEQALRVLKKKMQREGIFREMKQRRSYEKPSERKNREKSESIRRARKQAQRDGLLPPDARKLLDGKKAGQRPGYGPQRSD